MNMKKLFIGIFIVISTTIIFGSFGQKAEAVCGLISPNGRPLSGPADNQTVTITAIEQIPTLIGRIEIANECLSRTIPMALKAFSQGATLASEVFTAKTAYSDVYISLGAAAVNGQIMCPQETKIAKEGDAATWKCTVDVFYGEVDPSTNKVTTTTGTFTKKTIIIRTTNKDIEAVFNALQPKISFSSVGISSNEPCEIDNMDVRTYNGTAATSTFTVGEDGVFPPNGFGRIFFNTTLGCVVPVNKTIYIKVDVTKFISPPTGSTAPTQTKTKLINESKTAISQTNAYADFKPLFFDTEYCTEEKGSPDASGSRKFNCLLSVKADSNQTGLFNKNEKAVTYFVIFPKNLKPEDIKFNPVVTSTNIGGGVSVSQFGSNTIKEGFSWDPCYDPKTKKMITYPDLAKPVQTPLNKLDANQKAQGLNECYTLLSGLPIKLAGSDPVSAKIGYLEARDNQGKVIPGIFKTVIVGKFYVGDFVVYLFRLFMGIFALIAVAALIYVGIAIASNKENAMKLKVLKEWLGRIFLGIGIVLGSYIILSIIDPNLTELGFGVNNFNLSEQGFPDIEFSTSFDPVTGKKQTIAFADAYKIAKEAEAKTGIPAAFIIATLQQESGLGGNVGKCNIAGTPKWQEIMGNTDGGKADKEAYPKIMAALGRSTENQPLSCPSGGGRGGAMGPLQFIPSTWLAIASETAGYLGVPAADPWNMRQAIFAASVLYKRNGATTSYDSLRDAACKYYSGSPCTPGRNPPNEFYGDAVVKKAKQAEADIKLMLGEK